MPLRALVLLLAVAVLLLPAGSLTAQEAKKVEDSAQDDPIGRFIHGAPDKPTEIWLRAAGGRIYDNWWEALGRNKPEGAHPAYPKSGKRAGNSWRCVECHGWDYNGRDGTYRTGGTYFGPERYTGIKGIRAAAGRGVNRIMAQLRAAPHGYTRDMMTDEELRRVAIFVSRGQDDAGRAIDPKTGNTRGDVTRGSALFQTTCAACHGFDGRALNWGSAQEPAFVGTEANAYPHEVLHKIRNGHPGAAMINLRASPLKDAIDILAYSRTLPVK